MSNGIRLPNRPPITFSEKLPNYGLMAQLEKEKKAKESIDTFIKKAIVVREFDKGIVVSKDLHFPDIIKKSRALGVTFNDYLFATLIETIN